jgi:hypothetical protein
MSDTQQMPEACPFCGAEARTDWGFRCGSGPTVAKPERSIRCRDAERDRLTRDLTAAREQAKKAADEGFEMALRYQARIKRLEGHSCDLSPAMVQARNDQLNTENTKLKERVKRLEKAGDRMRTLCADGDDCDAWDAAKEAKP